MQAVQLYDSETLTESLIRGAKLWDPLAWPVLAAHRFMIHHGLDTHFRVVTTLALPGPEGFFRTGQGR